MTDRSCDSETVGGNAGEMYSTQLCVATKQLNGAALNWEPGEGCELRSYIRTVKGWKHSLGEEGCGRERTQANTWETFKCQGP